MDWNGEIGNAVPESVWQCRVHRYVVPGALVATAANELLEIAVPLVRRICAGYEVVLDRQSNRVGTCTEDAQDAGLELQALCDDYGQEHQLLQVWDADVWMGPNSDEDLGITANTTDEEIEIMAATIDEEAMHDQGVYLDDTEKELTWRRDALRDDD